MKKVIVTGADGFIGRRFINKCIEKNIEVWAAVRTNSDQKSFFRGKENIHVVQASSDEWMLRQKEFPKDADAFYHFAWQGTNAEKRDDFEFQFENIRISMNAVKFASYMNAKKFIMPGSVNEYLYSGKPLNKDAIPAPYDAYGAVKTAVAYLTRQYALKTGTEYIYTVITSIYDADRNDNNVISYVTEKLLKGEKPSLTKAEQIWDFIASDDAVEALLLCGEKGKNDSFYAVGKGDNMPLIEYIETVRDIIDPKLPLGIGEIPYKNGKIPGVHTDLTSIYEDTGFIPRIDFKTGITDVINEIRKKSGL